MEINKYVILVANDEMDKVVDLIDYNCNVLTIIDEEYLGIETSLDKVEVKNILNNTFCIIYDITGSLLNELLNDILDDDGKDRFIMFINRTDVSSSIDEILDLISKRGGIDRLSTREFNKLQELSENLKKG